MNDAPPGPLMLGEVSVQRVGEYQGPIPLASRELFPDSSEEVWAENEAWLAPDFWDPAADRLVTTLQSWVLRSGDLTIVVDTGAGNGRDRPDSPMWSDLHTGYLDALAGAGIAPDDVDVVVNTHLHADHVGWNTRRTGDGAWEPTFPHARYLVPRVEYDFWVPRHGPQPEGNRNVIEDSVAPVVDAGVADLWDGAEHRIDDAVRLVAAPGHTPGSCLVMVESGGAGAAFVGDLLHNPVQILEPDVNSCFCLDQAAARASRRRVLSWAADHEGLVFPAHFGGSGAAHVRRDGSAFAVRGWDAALTQR